MHTHGMEGWHLLVRDQDAIFSKPHRQAATAIEMTFESVRCDEVVV